MELFSEEMFSNGLRNLPEDSLQKRLEVIQKFSNSVTSTRLPGGEKELDMVRHHIWMELTRRRCPSSASQNNMVDINDEDADHSESAKRTSSECSENAGGHLDAIKRLEPGGVLNSVIMNFYILHLQKPMPTIHRPIDNYVIFNTFFYRKLETTLEDDFGKLRTWWKSINLFQKAYILLPVHGKNHWSLIIICMPAKEERSGPIILHLDSLGHHDSKSIFQVIHKFLIHEWRWLRNNCSLPELPMDRKVWDNLHHNIDKRVPKVPMQKNDTDCGLYVLYYMQRFLEQAPERFHEGELSMFSERWFRCEEIDDFRESLKELLIQRSDGCMQFFV